MKLIIGAGNRRLDGFKHHDVLPLKDLDYRCDFWDLPKHVEAGSCEEIHMTHVLEHFPMKRALEALNLVYGLLSDGGRFYIEVPNFYWHAEMILKNPRDRQIVEYAYGGQIDEYDFHYNGYTPELLEEDLMASLFSIETLIPNTTIECWAVK